MDYHQQTPTRSLPIAAHRVLQEVWTRVRPLSCVRLLHQPGIKHRHPSVPQLARSVRLLHGLVVKPSHHLVLVCQVKLMSEAHSIPSSIIIIIP
jgi:hypothetical protein